MFLTKRDDEGIVVLKTDDDFQKAKEAGEIINSLPRCHTKFFEDGHPQVVSYMAKNLIISTPAEIRKYEEYKKSWQDNHSANIIWDSNGLMLGNYVRRSNDNYWSNNAKGQIIRLTLDEFIMIDTQAPRGLFEYCDLNDKWLDDFGFHVDKTKAHIIYNESGNIFQINKINQFAGNTPIVRYEFVWGAVHIRHVHHLQNIASSLAGLDLKQRDERDRY